MRHLNGSLKTVQLYFYIPIAFSLQPHVFDCFELHMHSYITRTSGNVEDEKYVLLSCESFTDDRNHLLRCVSKSCPKFKNLDIHNKSIWIMNTKNLENLSILSNFI